jgi:hypothetical protein
MTATKGILILNFIFYKIKNLNTRHKILYHKKREL